MTRYGKRMSGEGGLRPVRDVEVDMGEGPEQFRLNEHCSGGGVHIEYCDLELESMTVWTSV